MDFADHLTRVTIFGTNYPQKISSKSISHKTLRYCMETQPIRLQQVLSKSDIFFKTCQKETMLDAHAADM